MKYKEEKLHCLRCNKETTHVYKQFTKNKLSSNVLSTIVKLSSDVKSSILAKLLLCHEHRVREYAIKWKCKECDLVSRSNHIEVESNT